MRHACGAKSRSEDNSCKTESGSSLGLAEEALVVKPLLGSLVEQVVGDGVIDVLGA